MPPNTGQFAVMNQPRQRHGGIEVIDGGRAMGGDMGMQFVAVQAEGNGEVRPTSNKRRRQQPVEPREDPQRAHMERLNALMLSSATLHTAPESHPEFAMRLYPKSLERAALLRQIAYEEGYALDCARQAYDEERVKVEHEWRKGLERVRERLLEGIEERRRRAREEKDGEGMIDSALDGNSRPHVTRKLRNKMGAPSPPPPSSAAEKQPPLNLNPNSLAVEELPSPFPLTLTDVALASSSGAAKRAKKGGAQIQAVGLGKAILQLTQLKDSEVDSDLGEIRRASKKRRTAATTGASRM